MRQVIAAGADLNEFDDFRMTPLLWAIMRGDIAAIRMLLESGADPNVRPNPSDSPLWSAEDDFGLVETAITVPFIAAQDKREGNCGGLHAAIRAELVRRDPPYTQPPFVMLSFILLNDSEAPINAVEGGWRIVIDGKELKDSDFIFGNGPHPTGGYGTLKPGESYELGKGLELSRYFPEEREYKVSWKGKMFQSSTITVSVTPKQ